MPPVSTGPKHRAESLTANGKLANSGFRCRSTTKISNMPLRFEQARIELLKRVFDLRWSPERELIIACEFPASWHVKAKSITHYSEAINVAPVLYLVTGAGQKPGGRLGAGPGFDRGGSVTNRLLGTLEYDETGGWRGTAGG